MTSEKVLINLKNAETGDTYGIYVSPDEAVRIESGKFIVLHIFINGLSFIDLG